MGGEHNEKPRRQVRERRVLLGVAKTAGSGSCEVAPSKPVSREVLKALRLLPVLEGARISIRFQPELTARGGELFSGGQRGMAVHAGSFLRKRLIILETELLECPGELSRILVHELFHFVWWRLGNRDRRSFEELLKAEFRLQSRGELGWSSELRKTALVPNDLRRRSVKWREYAAESFCDTAAYVYSVCRRHSEYTLAQRFRRLRRRWFETGLPAPLKT